jgi:hypothetical protein
MSFKRAPAITNMQKNKNYLPESTEVVQPLEADKFGRYHFHNMRYNLKRYQLSELR